MYEEVAEVSAITTPIPAQPRRTPPLQNGDRLIRDEFERRWEAMPELKRAELIEGVVYIPLPVSHDWHSAPHFDLIGSLAIYRSATPGIRVATTARFGWTSTTCPSRTFT